MTRWLLRMVEVLCLGAVTSVVIAWGSVLFQPAPGAPAAPAAPVEVYEVDEFYLWIYRFGGGQRHAVLSNRLASRCRFIPFPAQSRLEAIPWWLSAQGDQLTEHLAQGRAASATIHASGFPIPCLRREEWSVRNIRSTAPTSRPPSAFFTGFQVKLSWLPDFTQTSPNGATFHRTFPIAVIPFGFAANTAIYGGAWLLILFVPGHLRRRIRHRRDRCLLCGYDRAGLTTCPECGASSLA